MRLLMGIIKNRHGVYVARKKLPDDLCEAVAALLDNGKVRVPWRGGGLQCFENVRRAD